jgi:hypothetical protein
MNTTKKRMTYDERKAMKQAMNKLPKPSQETAELIREATKARLNTN